MLYSQPVPDIAPFRGIRFDPAAVGDLATVVAPPYDVISEQLRSDLEAASPHNIVRLILGRDEPGDDETSNKYMRARALLEAWTAAGVLRRDERDALYVYQQSYRIRGEQLVQRGILAAVDLDEETGVLPHERTYADVVDDRLRLLRATATNLDCILCVYEGTDRAASEAIEAAVRAEPVAAFGDPDGEHALWAMTEPASIAAVAKAMRETPVVIADGHHRHATALRYRDERRASEGPGPWDRQLMLLVDASRLGPSVLPIHRTIASPDAAAVAAALVPAFRLETAPDPDPRALGDEIAKRRIYGRAYGVVTADGAWLATVSDRVAEREAMPAEASPAWRDLDVSVLHRLVFDRLLGGVEAAYAHTEEEAVAAVRAGEATVAFLLAPPAFPAIRAVAQAGEALPQKSTFFVPKPKTGIVLRDFA